MMITIIIADDHPLVRNGLKSMLQSENNLLITGEASHGEELVEEVKTKQPDIVITDIKMPGMDGIEAVKSIKKLRPETGIIALSMFDKEYIVLNMMAAGAYGYLLKDADKRQIIDAIHCVYNHEPYYNSTKFSRQMIRRLADFNFPLYHRVNNLHFLKDVEKQIIRYICEGLTNKEIAYNLHLKVKTIENYRKRMMDELEITNIASLVVYAVRTGLYELPEAV